MNHTILRIEFTDVANATVSADSTPTSAFTRAVSMAWELAYAITGIRSSNDWLIVPLRDDVAILAKTRGYRASEDLLGWGVLVLTREEYSAVEALPEGERDNYLVNLLGFEGDEAAWWTRRY